jgi:hypothetical protein
MLIRLKMEEPWVDITIGLANLYDMARRLRPTLALSVGLTLSYW